MSVQSQLMKHRRMDVGDVVAVFNSMEADLVRGAVNDAALNTAAG